MARILVLPAIVRGRIVRSRIVRSRNVRDRRVHVPTGDPILWIGKRREGVRIR